MRQRPQPQHNDYDAVIGAPFGALGVRIRDGAVGSVDFLPQELAERAPATALARAAVEQLQHYFDDGNSRFTLPLEPRGTEFQRRVWRLLQAIPPGHTETYGSLARRLGSSARAVGGACRANPIPIIVPCHRVVASSGIGGFAGATQGHNLAIKHWLLDHER